MNFILYLFLFFSFVSYAKLVRYEMEMNTKKVNYTGKEVEALAINGQIPAPVISATVGDVLQVTFKNKMDKDSSIHWHGVLLPNDQDGVPYLTTQPIKAHSSFTYRFKVRHSGTYWYHSHTGLQEQRGLYGPLIFYPKSGERIKSDRDYVVVLSDWTDESPYQVLANLKKDGDWYALKKRSVQSWNRVIAHGMFAIKNRLYGAWTRMGPMDISDIGYDLFLSNGKQESRLRLKPGEKSRLRIINSAASTYFHTEFAGGPMLLVSADGVDVEPVRVKRLWTAIAETYDVIVSIPHNKSYELRSTSEDGTGFSSVFIGEGEKVLAPEIPRPNLFITDPSHHGLNGMNHKKQDPSHHNSSPYHQKHHNNKTSVHSHRQQSHKKTEHKAQNQKNHGGRLKARSHFHKERHGSAHKAHSQNRHKMHSRQNHKTEQKESADAISVIDTMTDYKHLRSVEDTSLGRVHRTVLFRLTGNMERYVWSFNNKTLLESDKILIKKGETVKFVLINETMMHHPIHLHGHFFRVLNGQGHKSPLKHTVNVPAGEIVEIEFKANEEKDWFFHCHNLYHMKTGMSRVISYQEKNTKKDKGLFSKISSDPWYFLNDISLMTHMIRGDFRVSNTRNAFEMEYDYNYKRDKELDFIYVRSFTRFLEFYGGLSLEREERPSAVFGVRYVLPFLVEVNLQINSNKKIEVEFKSDLQLTERSQLEWMFDTDKDYRLELSYELTKNFLITAVYDSEFMQGAGVRFKF